MEIAENLTLEHLKRFQIGQDRIEHKLDEVIARVGHIELGLAGVAKMDGFKSQCNEFRVSDFRD